MVFFKYVYDYRPKGIFELSLFSKLIFGAKEKGENSLTASHLAEKISSAFLSLKNNDEEN